MESFKEPGYRGINDYIAMDDRIKATFKGKEFSNEEIKVLIDLVIEANIAADRKTVAQKSTGILARTETQLKEIDANMQKIFAMGDELKKQRDLAIDLWTREREKGSISSLVVEAINSTN